ncbi:hypothetical protein [Streptomyces sp. NPDC093676]|uniref:hypothetical protein n=1 Tax=Streptomyces sp. NPDC093676 TaxID=3366050 RepID=UPI003817B092
MPQAKATPTGAGLQTTLALFGMAIVGTVIGTALFGSPEKSERAFRLLHWWKRDPEPAPPAQGRAQRTKRQ